MTSSGLLNTGFLWRAVVVSLLLHAFLLLQSPPRMQAPQPPLVAVLRSEVKTQYAGTPMVASSSTKETGKRARSSAAPSFAAPTAAMSPASIATASPQTEPAAMDVGEAGKSYLFALAREMRQVKRILPDVAASHAGTSEIRIAIARDGSSAPPQLFKSSGYPELDRAALAMTGMALQRASVPAGLLGEAFELVLPISFDPAD